MERKEVDTQQFIDHTLLASELMRDPNHFIMDLIDHTGVFPKTEGPTNLTTSTTTNTASAPELNFHNTIFQFVNKIHEQAGSHRPAVSPTPERTRSYNDNNAKQATDVEFLTLNSSFLSAEAVAASNAEAVPQLPQPAYPVAIEPSMVPMDVDDDLLYSHNASNINARKVLPHKKRISRKLKGTMGCIEATPTAAPTTANIVYDLEEPHKQVQHVQVVTSNAANALLYSCEICGYAVQTQLDFFAHLKQHYEPPALEQRLDPPHHPQQQHHPHHPQQQQHHPHPHHPQQQQPHHQKEPLDMCGSLTAQDKLQQEQAKLDQVFHDVQLNFDNFHNISHVHVHDENVGVGVGVNMVIHSDAMALHKLNNSHSNELKLPPVTTPFVPKSTIVSNNLVSPAAVVDDVEFSDTEDMLEGIRNVVDKVSIEDTCDELDLELNTNGMRAPWFNNNFSDIAFSVPLSQLLLPCKAPPRLEASDAIALPVIKPSDNNAAEQLSLNFLNTNKRVEEEEQQQPQQPLPKLESHSSSSKKDEDDVTSSAIEQLQRSPLLLSESSFKLEDGEAAAPPPTSHSSSAASDSIAPPSPTPSQEQLNGESYLLDKIIAAKPLAETEEEAISPLKAAAGKKLFRCEKCTRDFNSYNALKYHNHTHTQQRAHQCDHCGRSFYTLSALKAHERTHSGEKPFNCEQCEAKFRQWGDLKYHIISRHSEIKAHMCEYCGKSFSRKYSLVVHRRIHTSERNYSCEYCEKSFRASSYLLTHIKVHTGEKPYGCTLCDKRFRVSGDLKRHMRVHERLPESETSTTTRKKKRSKLKAKFEAATALNKFGESDAGSEQEILGL